MIESKGNGIIFPVLYDILSRQQCNTLLYSVMPCSIMPQGEVLSGLWHELKVANFHGVFISLLSGEASHGNILRANG